jgi:hypothetical protein
LSYTALQVVRPPRLEDDSHTVAVVEKSDVDIKESEFILVGVVHLMNENLILPR